MENFAKSQLEEARRAIADMLGRSRKAQGKFAPGTSQHSLQKNRIQALSIAAALLAREGGGGNAPFSKEELEAADKPLTSLLHKSEKAREKLTPGSWQHGMLSANCKALSLAMPLVGKALGALEGETTRGLGSSLRTE